MKEKGKERWLLLTTTLADRFSKVVRNVIVYPSPVPVLDTLVLLAVQTLRYPSVAEQAGQHGHLQR